MNKKTGTLAAIVATLLLPFAARANMNGGLHIPDWVIAVVVILGLLIIVSFFLSIWNVWLKSRGMRIFTMIIWVPFMGLGVLALRAGSSASGLILLPLLQVPLMLASVRKKEPDQTPTDETPIDI